MKIKSIFFDIGGVLAIEDRKKQYSELSKIMGFNLDEFEKLRSEKVELFSRGKISEEEYLSYFSKRFNLNYEKLRNNWVNLAKKYYKLNQEVYETIRKLSKRYLLGTLTNIIPIHNKIRKEEDPYKFFKIKLLSFEQGYRKPDKEFYNLILEKTKLKANEIVFIDDHEPYLEPARMLGMKTILFKNNKNLTKELKDLGVILSP